MHNLDEHNSLQMMDITCHPTNIYA